MVLCHPSNGDLFVVYDLGDAGGVRIARRTESWSVATVFDSFHIVRGGAALDERGAMHLALTDGTSVFYTTNRAGQWSQPQLVFGLPPENPTIDVDFSGNAYITSNTHLHARAYASAASGWAVAEISDTSTAPAAILAREARNPLIAYADWSERAIYVAQGPDWRGSRYQVFRYGADQGPPLALRASHSEALLAYAVTTDAYHQYEVRFVSRSWQGGWSQTETVYATEGGLGAVDVFQGAGGRAHVVFCDAHHLVHLATRHDGNWQTMTLPDVSCGPELGAVLRAGKLWLAYMNRAGELALSSVSITEHTQ